MNNIQQTQQLKELIKISGLSKAIPTSKTMVTVASLLTKVDKAHIKEYNLGSIAVKVSNEAFFLSEIQKVPQSAEIQRDTQGDVLGIRAVAGG